MTHPDRIYIEYEPRLKQAVAFTEEERNSIAMRGFTEKLVAYVPESVVDDLKKDIECLKSARDSHFNQAMENGQLANKFRDELELERGRNGKI
jgi:hypothetical protein